MKKAYLLLLAGMLSTAVFASNKQTLKIEGQVIEKTISEITFDGGNVVLHYADNSSDQADMSRVTLSFSYSTTTGISQVEGIKQALQGKVYNLQGQCVGSSLQGLSKGVYIINGKKVIIK
nr:subtilase [Prevotella sp.]